ncbi:MAG: electron transport complex subunit RsxC [Candidatus Aureabacteria bacterium]|nr:electron transport complex subunit RsxC [Candidatus Auribacterota bacterium]NLW93651.1 electron transport complex subunit RsxC [Chlamydiota bacterium]HOE27721.1 electron transport complex subunit RsxC [bacterium]HQM52963.1 electron transport complex subunit RsxC [bacterium]
MKARTFRGGVHPSGRKELTAGRPIRVAAVPASVRIPLHQNAGQPPRPVVEAGQRVRTGELIAEASGRVSACLHASISGTVKSIGPVPVPYGGTDTAIEIQGDGNDERGWGPGAPDPFALTGEEISERIRLAGIVGLGGAEFPTHVKLRPPPGKKFDCLIINGAECEPYLTADHRLMAERPADVIAGTRLLMKAAGVARARIGVESNKPDAFSAIAAAAARDKGIEVISLKVKYPQGAEKQLIAALLGREVPPGALPADVGTVVQNAGTAAAVAEAVRDGKPLYERVVTVSGSGVREPGNWLARVGTPFSDLVAQSGGLVPGAAMVIMGGPMMGTAQWTLDVPVVKGTSGIVVLTEDETAAGHDAPCIRCGRCLAICPMGLSPALLRQAVEKERWDLAGELGATECIECGACAFVCASGRDQVQGIRRSKLELSKKGGKGG